MSSETERITHEVMDRHGLWRLGESLPEVPLQETEGQLSMAIDPDFTNKRYMELERGKRF